MSFWNRIGDLYKSHPFMLMFSQLAFNRHAAVHPWAAHLGATFFGLILAFVAFAGIPNYLSQRHLLQYGIEVSAIVDDVGIQPIKSGRFFKSGRVIQMYEVTLQYHFAASDGCLYDGTSRLSQRQVPTLSRGMHIAVLHEAGNPRNNGWRGQSKGRIATYSSSYSY